MFMGPWDQGGPWSPTGIGGVHRFLNRVWTLAIDEHGREPGDPDAGSLPAGESEADAQAAIRAAAHRTLRDVTADYEAFHFNTMIAKLMELSNTLFRYRGTAVAGTPAWDEAIRLLLLMLAPAAPHITEELWSRRLADGRRAVGLDPHPDVAGGRPERGHRIDPRDPGPGQRQAARQGRRPRRRVPGRHRGGRPRPRQDQGDPRRARRRTGSSSPAAGSSSTSSSGDLGRRPRVRPPPRCDRAGRRRHRTSPAPDRSRGLPRRGRDVRPRLTGCWPSAPADPMRDFSFAIIPHKAHVNLQLADGVDLPNPDGHIEGTGKRVRHVKVRSVEDARALVGPGRDRRPARSSVGLNAVPGPGPSPRVRQVADLSRDCPVGSPGDRAGTSPAGRRPWPRA